MAIVFTGSPFAPAAFAQQKTMQQQKWEYKIVNSCDPKDRGTDIQQLGEEGWELVATDLAGENQCATRYFKRPKGSGSKQATKQPSQQSTAPQCSVPLDKAPPIRGLRLGMSVDELLSIFAPNTNSKFLLLTDFVVTISSLPLRMQSRGYATSSSDKQSH